MQTNEREKIYECEVKRLFLVNGRKVPKWTTKSVVDVMDLGDVEIRCKYCWGAIKLFKKRVPHAPAPHVEHKLRQDSEFCPSGIYFKKSDDGRQQRQSEFPVV